MPPVTSTEDSPRIFTGKILKLGALEKGSMEALKFNVPESTWILLPSSAEKGTLMVATFSPSPFCLQQGSEVGKLRGNVAREGVGLKTEQTEFSDAFDHAFFDLKD